MDVESKLIYSEEAIRSIKQTIDELKYSPFFFIVGAGVSMPTIKGSKEIISECQQIAHKFDNTISYSSDDESSKYSFWMKKAYPSRRARQEYIKSLITKASISPANMKLAHILQSKKIATTVFTPNFDDHILKSINLFGIHDVMVCENESSALKINLDSSNIQIVHVHGTYWFYDCSNLDAEMQSTATQDGFIIRFSLIFIKIFKYGSLRCISR